MCLTSWFDLVCINMRAVSPREEREGTTARWTRTCGGHLRMGSMGFHGHNMAQLFHLRISKYSILIYVMDSLLFLRHRDLVPMDVYGAQWALQRRAMP